MNICMKKDIYFIIIEIIINKIAYINFLIKIYYLIINIINIINNNQ